MMENVTVAMTEFGLRYGCISMQRYWSSIRYSFLRTLFVLAADIRPHPTPAHPFPVSSVVLVWPVPRGVSVIPRAVSLRVSISRSACMYSIAPWTLPMCLVGWRLRGPKWWKIWRWRRPSWAWSDSSRSSTAQRSTASRARASRRTAPTVQG